MLHVVITSINYPENVKSLSNLSKNNKLDIKIVIVTDKKSPNDVDVYLKKFNNQFCEIVCLDLKAQKNFLKPFKKLSKHLRFNSIQRRNVGYLYSIQDKADYIITMDDDNYPLKDKNFKNFYKFHSDFDKKKCLAVNKKNKWLNICDFLVASDGRRFYHRGHPIENRFDDNQNDYTTNIIKKPKISANAGLWLVDPDIDTFERVTHKFQVTGTHKILRSNRNILAGRNTYSVFNSQNTSFTKESIYAYYLVDIGESVKTYNASHHNFRYDDIWSSVIFNKISKQLNYYISYGAPYVYQIRNIHNFKKDICREHIPLMASDNLYKMIIDIKLKRKISFQDSYIEFVEEFDKLITSKKTKMDELEYKMYSYMIKGCYTWIEACSKI